MDSWDDKTSGQKRTKLKVVAENIQLMGSPGGGGGAPQSQGGGQQQAAPQQSPQGGSPAQGGNFEDSDDIPF